MFLDLEDAVAPDGEGGTRGPVIAALTQHDFGAKTVVVRINGDRHAALYRDVIDVVEQAGRPPGRDHAPQGPHAG